MKCDTVTTIQEMLDEGFYVIYGRHVGAWGFFCYFITRQKIDDLFDVSWHESGHGFDLDSAVLMARDIALGRSVDVPDREQFELDGRKYRLRGANFICGTDYVTVEGPYVIAVDTDGVKTICDISVSTLIENVTRGVWEEVQE